MSCRPRCIRTPRVPVKARLPRAASRLAAAFTQRTTGYHATNPGASSYIPPLTAALLTMHTTKVRNAAVPQTPEPFSRYKSPSTATPTSELRTVSSSQSAYSASQSEITHDTTGGPAPSAAGRQVRMKLQLDDAGREAQEDDLSV